MSVVIDILIVLVLLGCLVQGLQRGLIGSVGSIVGLVAGGVGAWFVAPPVGALLPDPTARIALTLGVALVLVLLGTGLGSRLGSALGRPIRRTPLAPIDRVLGAGLQVAAGALVVAALAMLVADLGAPSIARPVAGSVVAQRIEALTPTPVAQAVGRIEAGAATAAANTIDAVAVPAPSMR